MQDVIDLEYTLGPPGIQFIDFQEFVEYRSSNLLSSVTSTNNYFCLESRYSHYNTIYTHNRTDLEGTASKTKWGDSVLHHDVNRMDSDEHPAAVWTLLDAFYAQLHSSVEDSSFPTRFTRTIRQTASSSGF